MTDTIETGDELAERAEGIFSAADRRHMAGHRKGDCVLLDDRCCVEAWQWLRGDQPKLVADIELIYGNDWWTRFPAPLRSLLGAIALTSEHDDAEIAAAFTRGLATVRLELEHEKVEAIKRGRAVKK